MKIRLRQWEKEWWEDIITQCETACQQGRMGEMYRILRKLGTRGNPTQNANQITAADFKEHFSSVSEKRNEREPEQIEEALEMVLDLRENEEAKGWNDMLNQRPEEEEIVAEMKNVKDSALGRDEVRMRYINSADAEIRRLVIETVQHMFTTRAQRWDESLKTGIMIPIHKKGPRDVTNNYRGVVLLAMCSRILARVVASRLRSWTEKLNLVDENQNGFRPGRSTADATQVFVRIQEDMVDLRKRRRLRGLEEESEEDPEARLLDLRKAYPRHCGGS